ncbi:prolipoprotein diacylglyceryl transferase [Candidatus Woesearchaeota archaeon]|jgi:phosphatidylglycerol---prolipoprotein diacylglyceryl transferase|nr:prolipoprotein diacylglyceryl transferase [Candidatus Woesearchaeota archaeon]MBT5272678.1 prolipoprotein diacylglyceryl transferase [Candidatus Woesearchaeota archaeon]MBT6041285.1 prolipoprotein diacylglyceryl transferase [Candidatus Woesearchaeota archaeon]MBT6337077.1 prolipoprotein diacylglyceryl transferase [Candidatus Woesearchaeota archaeon]MBT7927869.1 prolipoprotein diacylglyceryl transferase [Candidatus Woesearchaeota archaeon]
MINFNLDPTIFAIGPFEVRYYGLVYVIGFLLAYLWLWWGVKKKKIDLSMEDVDTLILYLMLGVILGSRLFHVIFWQPVYYFTNPLQIFAFWKGGMAFHGGLIGGLLGIWLFCRKNEIKEKITLARLADYLVIPTVFALALGRLANFLNGELPGTTTNVSWCFNFPGYEGCRHPSQLYGALKRFIILGILVVVDKLYIEKSFAAGKRIKDGFLFWVFVGLFGIGRFIINFYRDDPRWLGLSLGQYLGVGMFLLAVVVWWKYYRRN